MKKLIILLYFILAACSQNNEVHYDPPAPTTAALKAWNPTTFPLTIYIPAELNDFQPAILASQTTWNNAFKGQVFHFVFNDPSKVNTQWVKQYDSLYDSYFGLFKINAPNWNYELGGNPSSVLAFTGTLTQNGLIIHADMLFNFQSYGSDFGDANTLGGSNKIDFESVLTHEMGHFLGLNHITASEDAASVMLPSITRGTSKRNLSVGDIQRIKVLYNLP